jgi:class 3 adenylate cyclase/pimeloyl-ACP methyl ester carboxylesterase
VAIAYQVVGSGPQDLVMVFGYVSNLEYAWAWPSLERFLTSLSQGCRLILLDLRGTGLSDRTDRCPTHEDWLADVMTVLDEVGSARATLFGIWEGSLTSTLFAATYPDRVSSLVLFGASAAQMEDADYPWGWSESKWEEWLDSIRSSWGTRAWVVRNARWMSPSLLEAPDELEHWISFTRLAASPSSAEAMLRLQSRSDVRAVLPTVHTPTLVLHRKGDQIEELEGARYLSTRMPNARLVELDGEDGIPWLGDSEAIVRQVRRFRELTETEPEPVGEERRLATVLFTDIVGSTSTSAQLGDAAWGRLVESHHTAVRAQLAHYRGVEVDTAGDGFFATFDGPGRAVHCASAIVAATRALGIDVRAGIHTGEIETIAGKPGGMAVVIGARIAALAAPSQVLVSQTVKDLTIGSGITLHDEGEQDLKGVPDRWRVYRVLV